VRPGYYRYDELTRLGVNVDLVENDYDRLHATLEEEAATGTRRANTLRERKGYSFDATIDRLIGLFERVRETYYARPAAERTRLTTRRRALVHFNTSPDPRAHARGLLRRLLPPPGLPGGERDGRVTAVVRAVRSQARRPVVAWRA